MRLNVNFIEAVLWISYRVHFFVIIKRISIRDVVFPKKINIIHLSYLQISYVYLCFFARFYISNFYVI